MDAIKFLTRQHAEVEKLFARYERSPQEGRELFGLIERALVPHAIIEEMHVYPTVRARLTEGERLAQYALNEHKDIEQRLAEIASLIADDKPFELSLKRLIDMVREHVRDEESFDGLFGRLSDVLSPRDLSEMGAALQESWGLTPTRAHPRVPDKLLGVPLAIVDRVRDRLSGRTEAAQPSERRVLAQDSGSRRAQARSGARKRPARKAKAKTKRSISRRRKPAARRQPARQRARRTMKSRRR